MRYLSGCIKHILQLLSDQGHILSDHRVVLFAGRNNCAQVFFFIWFKHNIGALDVDDKAVAPAIFADGAMKSFSYTPVFDIYVEMFRTVNVGNNRQMACGYPSTGS